MKSRLSVLFAVAALALSSTGCDSTRLQDASVTPGTKHDEWRSFFFWGPAGKAKIDVREYCPNGEVREVATGTNVGTAIARGITLSIYSPEKIYVTCAAEGEWAE